MNLPSGPWDPQCLTTNEGGHKLQRKLVAEGGVDMWNMTHLPDFTDFSAQV